MNVVANFPAQFSIFKVYCYSIICCCFLKDIERAQGWALWTVQWSIYVVVRSRMSLLLSANEVLSMLALLLQQEEVWEGPLPPRSIYVLFIQGFNGIYIFFQAVVENKVFFVPWRRSEGNWTGFKLWEPVGTLCDRYYGGTSIRALKYFALHVKWKQIKVDFCMKVLAVCSGRTVWSFPVNEGQRWKRITMFLSFGMLCVADCWMFFFKEIIQP